MSTSKVRARRTGETLQLHLSEEMHARLVALAPLYEAPWLLLKMPDVVRAVLTVGLPLEEERLRKLNARKKRGGKTTTAAPKPTKRAQ